MDEITKELLEALKTIESWNSHTTAYAVDFGSNGVRDFYRAIARQSIAKAEAILAATQSDNGWIPWEGGECPVTVGTRVDAKFRDGEKAYNVPAGRFTEDPDSRSASVWSHIESDYDIIAYRVVKP
jgi:hypothetical protein